LLDNIGSAGNSYFPVVHLAYLPRFLKKTCFKFTSVALTDVYNPPLGNRERL
jgi:hypothetical protein